ncbi:MAG: hypothetical protein IJK73_05525 [Bacteroidales bacterium]|nr:hypothetical protein [Bacteroidales bacterium]
MGNIDEKVLSSILERIEGMKKDIEALENQLKELITAPAEVVAESVPVEAVAESVPAEVVAESAPAVDDIPIDITIPEPAPVAEPSPVAEPTPVPEPAPVILSEAKDLAPSADLPVPDPVEGPALDVEPLEIIDDIPEPAPTPAAPARKATKSKKSILDSAKADTAVMDVMAEKQAWRTDRPGMPVKNIISAISLNDRVLLINVLFNEDPMEFQGAIAKFNAMSSFNEALDYIGEHYPSWDLSSEPVYRLMMAIRRKLS